MTTVVRRARQGRLRRTRKLIRSVQEPVYRRALRHRVIAAIELETVPFEHDFASIIDVGAHRGQFALVGFRRFPAAAMMCFEPLPEAAATLRRVVAAHPASTVLEAAAGASAGEATLHIARSSDSSSLRRATDAQRAAFPGSLQLTSTVVRVVCLDDVIDPPLPRPCLLKLDTQGSELEVLLGAQRLLDGIDEVLVECSFVELYAGQASADEVVVHLLERGFALSGGFSVATDSRSQWIQADLLFVRR